MKKSYFALLTMIAVTLGAIGFGFAAAEDSNEKANAQISQLAARLPKSDGVMMMDMRRLMNDAVPQILSGRMQLLGDINQKIEQIKAQTGIDLRQFEQLAVGVNFSRKEAGKIGVEPFVLARGSMNAGALLAVAKVAAKGKYREENLSGKTVYVFSAKEIFQDNKPAAKTPQDEAEFAKMLAQIPAEIAVTNLDENTLAFGSMSRVAETLGKTSSVAPELLALAGRKPSAVVSFAANAPKGLAQLLKLDNDEIAKNLDSIQQVYGSMDLVGQNSLVDLTAKTDSQQQAQNLEDMLAGLQMLGKGLLGGTNGANKQIYIRMVDNAKISRQTNEVTLSVQVANSDLSALLAKK